MNDTYIRSSKVYLRSALLASAALYAGTTAQIAHAQVEPEQASAAEADTGGDVIITGSRIVRRDLTSSSPISTLSETAITSTGAVTLEKAIGSLPQFGLGENSAQTGFGSTGQASLNLRGLGSFRNLVLLDGRRMQPSNAQQVVDINTIPKALIQNVEIITGGASAVYGSDAIAGVVNFITKRNFEGLAIDGQYNITGQGDGGTRDLSATLGGNFADGRGNAVFSVSYSERDPVGYQSRAFFRQNTGGTDLRLPVGAYTPGTNAPSQAAVNNLFSTYGVAPGSVRASSTLGFNADDTLFSANNGVFNFRGTQGLLLNTGTQVNYPNVYLTLQAPLERYTAFGRLSYELSSDVSAFTQLQYANYTTQIVVEAGNTSLSVPVTNPFIPAGLASLLASRPNPTANFTLQKRFNEAGPRLTNRDFEIVQIVAGLNGKLAAIDGTWELYASHGQTSINENQPGSVLSSSLRNVLNAADGGRSLCAGGYDPFGLTTLSEACYDYLVASPYRRTTLKQDEIQLNVQGGLFDLPAGQVRFAAGGGYRRNAYSTQVDRILQRADVVGVLFTNDSEGSSNVKEAYAEVLIPILKDVPFFRSLDIDLGYRFSDYNLAGSIHTYKADFNWQPVEILRLRGGYARAVRAPSVGELFVPPNGAIPAIGLVSNGQGDPCDIRGVARNGAQAAAVRTLCLAQGVPGSIIDSFVNLQDDTNATNSGNVNLKPETADTYTVGAVLSPRFSTPWFSRLNFTVDYYNITVKDAIGVITAPQILPKCFNLDGSNPSLAADNFFCSAISRDSEGRFSNVNQPTLNLGGYRTSGVDFQVDWKIGMDAVGMSAASSLTINSVVTWLRNFEVKTLPTDPYADYAGTVGSTSSSQPGSLPTWKAVTTVTYDMEQFSLGLRWRFLDAMNSSARATNPNSTVPGVPSYSTFDLFSSFTVGEDYSFRLGVNNLTNKQPLVVGGRLGATETSTYDVLGRTFYVGFGAKF